MRRRSVAVGVGNLELAIRRLEAKIVALKRQWADEQDRVFLLTLQRVIPPGVTFRCTEVLDHAMLHPDLAAVIGPMDAQQLGMYLSRLTRRWPDALECAYRDERGRHWQLRVAF